MNREKNKIKEKEKEIELIILENNEQKITETECHKIINEQ